MVNYLNKIGRRLSEETMVLCIKSIQNMRNKLDYPIGVAIMQDNFV